MKRSILRALGFLDLLIALATLVVAVVAAFPPTDLRVVIFAAGAGVVCGASGMAIFALDREVRKLQRTIKNQKMVIRLTEGVHDGPVAHTHAVGEEKSPRLARLGRSRSVGLVSVVAGAGSLGHTTLGRG